MAPKRNPMTSREIVKHLRADGWVIKRKGPGDHVQYVHLSKPGKVTVDMGVAEFPVKTLRSIFKQAGWDWCACFSRGDYKMPLAYAVLHQGDKGFGISFPDFPGCISGGQTEEDAIRRGEEALNFHVSGMIEDGDALPLLRTLSELKSDPEFIANLADGFLSIVPFDLPGKSVRINVSMDENLLDAIDKAAQAKGQSRSAYLAEAARARIRSGA